MQCRSTPTSGSPKRSAPTAWWDDAITGLSMRQFQPSESEGYIEFTCVSLRPSQAALATGKATRASAMGFCLRSHLHVEGVDDGFLVLVGDRTDFVHLKGSEARAFALAQGGATEVPDDLRTSMAGLIELGIVASDTWNRRKVLQAGGAAAAAAVAMIALPSVAAATSPGSTPTASPTTSMPPASSNLVANPSFEHATAYSPAPNWTFT